MRGGLRRRDRIEGGGGADASRMAAGGRGSRGRPLAGVARPLSLLRIHYSGREEVYKVWRIIVLFRYVVPSLADKGLFEACVNDDAACSRAAGRLKRDRESFRAISVCEGTSQVEEDIRLCFV